jgi:hypothetical protein
LFEDCKKTFCFNKYFIVSTNCQIVLLHYKMSKKIAQRAVYAAHGWCGVAMLGLRRIRPVIVKLNLLFSNTYFKKETVSDQGERRTRRLRCPKFEWTHRACGRLSCKLILNRNY